MTFIPPDPATTEWVPVYNPVGTGPQGPQGIQGVKGDKGDTGNTGPQGPIGNTGPQGIQGIQGPIGVPGEVWFTGSGAPSGAIGIVGDWYLDSVTGNVYEKTGASTWTLAANIKGPQGIQGIQGIQGPTGATGSQGPIGNTGAQGPQGNQGIQGIQGVQGNPGENWFSGSGAPAGSLAGSIVGDWYLDVTTGDVYEKTGGSTWTLRANIKGPQGAQGIQGIQGVQGPIGNTGPSGSTTPHAPNHRPGGSDPLVNAAWTDTANSFTQDQEIRKAIPRMGWWDTNQTVNNRLWRIALSGMNMIFVTLDDAITTVLKQPLTLFNTGSAAVQGILQVGGEALLSTLPAIRNEGGNRLGIVTGTQSAYAGLVCSTVVAGNGGSGLADLTLTGGPIYFPAAQISSANANALDDYERGAWTPTLNSAGGGSPVYTGTNGQYIKIGRHVFLSGTINLSNKSSLAAGGVYISGFPFVAAPNEYYGVHVTNWSSMITNVAWMGGIIYPSTSLAYLQCTVGAQAAVGGLIVANINNTFAMIFTASYVASA